MVIEQSFTVSYPCADVWRCFHDIPGIVACLPGASLTDRSDDGALKLSMSVKLGPIAANFAGDGRMALDDVATRGSVSGQGVDRKSASRIKGEAAFSLAEVSPQDTRVDVKVDYTIAGPLAQFSRGGLVKELATRLTEAFAANLKEKLDAAGMHARSSPSASTAGITTDIAAADTTAQTQTQTQTQTSEPMSPAAMQAAPQTSPTSARSPQCSVASKPTSLDLGKLFWAMLWSRLRGWLGFGGGAR